MDKIEQAREASSRIWAAGYTDESATIDSLIEQLAQLEREMVAATIRIDNDAMELAELATITTDRDEWKDATISANERFKRAEAELERIKGQEPVAWIPPEHEGVYRSSSYLDASRDQLAGWVPVYLAAGAQRWTPNELLEAESRAGEYADSLGFTAGAQSALKQEPVARLVVTATDTYLHCDVEVLNGEALQPNSGGYEVFLAAGAQERKPLTDEEISDLYHNSSDSFAFARAIEAKIKEQP